MPDATTHLLSPQEIQNLLAQRQKLRAGKQFAEADAIRDKLTAAGVTVQDAPLPPIAQSKG